MNTLRTIPPIGFILLTCFLITQRSIAQTSPFDPLLYKEASLITEHLEVFTDRSLYVVNEQIHFRADLITQGVVAGRAWSTVLYAELISNKGLPISRGKFPLNNGVCEGNLPIPAHMLTGMYFLKCYTRWMRNWGPDGYSYTPLRIIHPYKSQLDEQSREGSAAENWERSLYREEGINIELPDQIPARREQLDINVSMWEGLPYEEITCCISIVPANTLDTQEGQLRLEEATKEGEDYKLEFLPDLHGPTLSGRANPQQRIHLSLLGEAPDYYVTMTDDFGRFVLSIPDRMGSQELFVTSEMSGDQITEIRVDQDFDPDCALLSSPPFELTGQELNIATLMARRVQIEEFYKREDSPDTLTVKENPLPFYGKPSFTVELDEFVSLPTLSEVFINLVPSVSVLKRKDHSTLLIQGENPGLKIYPPLLMVDQIPVFDHQKILDIPPEKVRKIDVINEVYVKGKIYYGGILNVITHLEDMGGVDLPEASYFFDFEGFSEMPVPLPERGDLGSRIPDCRNTMLWIPDLTLTKGGRSDINFVAPDYPGSYMILIRGVAPNGEDPFCHCSF